MTGKKVAIATVTHSDLETAFCSGHIGEKIFGMARSGDLKLQGWPDFNSAITELQSPSTAGQGQAEYKVCQALADGTLIVKQTLVDLYTNKHPEFKEATMEALEKRNKEFNPENLVAGAESDAPQGGQDASIALSFDAKAEADKLVNKEGACLVCISTWRPTWQTCHDMT